MRAIVVLAALMLAACAPETLYKTTETRIANDGRYELIAPYFAEVTTRISVAIAPGTPFKAAAGSNPATPAGPPTITIAVSPLPKKRAYLYLSKNPWYSDTVNVGVGTDGMLTSSDSASTQQYTAILTELAQAAAAIHPLGGGGAIGIPPGAAFADFDEVKSCIGALSDRLTTYQGADARGTAVAFKKFDIGVDKSPYVVDEFGDTVKYKITLELTPLLNDNTVVSVKSEQPGLVAFYPAPATATIKCAADNTDAVSLSLPQVVNLYAFSDWVVPERDYLTNPQHTFSFTAGFITGHKYSDQSSVKTVVDTVTAPIRALMPSVTVTNQTQIQTGGGKPDQTTTSTSSQIGPPKGP